MAVTLRGSPDERPGHVRSDVPPETPAPPRGDVRARTTPPVGPPIASSAAGTGNLPSLGLVELLAVVQRSAAAAAIAVPRARSRRTGERPIQTQPGDGQTEHDDTAPADPCAPDVERRDGNTITSEEFERSEVAMALFLTRLQPTMARCLRGRLPDVETDVMPDLLQEAALHVVEGVHSCRAATDDQVRSWGCVVAIRAGLAFLRSRRSGQPETRDALTLEAASARTRVWAEWAITQDPPDAGVLAVLARLAADAQASLPPDTVALIWDRVIEDVSWAEAAMRLGTTPTGAKRRFQRAQLALRRLLWQHVAALPEPRRTALLDRLRALDRSLEPSPLGAPDDGPEDRARCDPARRAPEQAP